MSVTLSHTCPSRHTFQAFAECSELIQTRRFVLFDPSACLNSKTRGLRLFIEVAMAHNVDEGKRIPVAQEVADLSLVSRRTTELTFIFSINCFSAMASSTR